MPEAQLNLSHRGAKGLNALQEFYKAPLDFRLGPVRLDLALQFPHMILQLAPGAVERIVDRKRKIGMPLI